VVLHTKTAVKGSVKARQRFSSIRVLPMAPEFHAHMMDAIGFPCLGAVATLIALPALPPRHALYGFHVGVAHSLLRHRLPCLVTTQGALMAGH